MLQLPDKPDFTHETRLHDRGVDLVCGVDEAGRGPLAGPVVAAAVILDRGAVPEGLHDSKKLSEKRREKLFDSIMTTATVCFASVAAPMIDAINIRAASLLAMERAVAGLATPARFALIDGNVVPQNLCCPGEALVKGDARSISVSAASIVAKVIRDRMMLNADQQFPVYGFSGHKGYPTKSHREAVMLHGPCPLHRMTFAPVTAALAAQNDKTRHS